MKREMILHVITDDEEIDKYFSEKNGGLTEEEIFTLLKDKCEKQEEEFYDVVFDPFTDT